MATTVQTFTNASGTNQPFISSGGGKFIDNFSTADLAGSTNIDPYQLIAFHKIESVTMTVGGTSGTAGAGRMGIWKSAGVVFDYAAITLNGIAATVSSATASITATINAVIADATTYYAGAYGSASLAAKRDTNTGSFSSYSGNATSTTVGSTYNPGNLNFVLKYYYLPNAPAAPTVTSFTSTTATISWSAPTDPGGYAATTLRYKIYVTPATGSAYVAIEETAANASSATITGLVPGETYTFKVAAMNGIIPATGASYASTDSSVYIDWYSSGPYSPASASIKTKGGRYTGTTWAPMYSNGINGQYVWVTKSPAIAFTAGKVDPYDSYASVTISSTVNPFSVGDTITVSGTSTPAGFNGTWSVDTIGGSAGAWIIGFFQGYFNPSGTTVNATPNGTISGKKAANIKAYNGSTWVTIV